VEVDMTKTNRTWKALALLLALAGSARLGRAGEPPPAQATWKLNFDPDRHRVGDQVRSTTTSTLTNKAKVTGQDGSVVGDESSTSRASESTLATVLEVDAQGKPLRVRILVESWKSEAETEEEAGIQGRTIEATAEEWKLVGSPGEVSLRAAQVFETLRESWFDTEEVETSKALRPPHPVKIGERWEPDAPAALRSIAKTLASDSMTVDLEKSKIGLVVVAVEETPLGPRAKVASDATLPITAAKSPFPGWTLQEGSALTYKKTFTLLLDHRLGLVDQSSTITFTQLHSNGEANAVSSTQVMAEETTRLVAEGRATPAK
jgi:hypothetical protein